MACTHFYPSFNQAIYSPTLQRTIPFMSDKKKKKKKKKCCKSYKEGDMCKNCPKR
jgi:hypothetical protein